MDLKMAFGKKIKELRTKRKFTQFDLAEAVGIDEKHLSHIETGRSFPKAVLIEKFAQALNTDLQELFDFPKEIDTDKKINTILKSLNKMSDNDLDKVYKFVELFD